MEMQNLEATIDEIKKELVQLKLSNNLKITKSEDIVDQIKNLVASFYHD